MINNYHHAASNKLIAFFLLYTFVIAWSVWGIIIIGNQYFNSLWYGTLSFWIFYSFGSVAPAISSFIIYQQFRDSFNNKNFLNYIFGLKISTKVWLIFILFLIRRFAMIWISFDIHRSISFVAMLINLPFLIILGGVEELGWRGILQPKIESITTFLPSIVLVSIIWTVWHLPLWLIKGSVQSGFPFWLYYVSGLVLTASFTTFYKYSNNLFLCIVNHAWFNSCIGMALEEGNNGVLELHLNWKVILVFSLELIVALTLGLVNQHRKPKERL